ncbi:hypothetical protein [Microbacterium enclense]|uniref:hypothetical protein n=1 Tax=Microbacterium enclense TaxID=993073 RepID=UPI003D7237F9
MVSKDESKAAQAWGLFDAVVARAAPNGEHTNPWVDRTFNPDFSVLKALLGCVLAVVPDPLDTTSGVAAKAIDVWLAYELRRAGFASDNVWPRASHPRVVPPDITLLLDRWIPKKDIPGMRERITGPNPPKGVVSANANILGRNYIKQVDVVMSAWATGPEILISTKRMDAAYGKNVANRIEEANGDAKNLRGRHPQAAIGFVFGLSAAAFEEERGAAYWIRDQLTKLNCEDDAYDAVALILPKYHVPQAVLDERERKKRDRAARRSGGAPEETTAPSEVALEPGATDEVDPIPAAVPDLEARLDSLPKVELDDDRVPTELRASAFLGRMVMHVLEVTPITMHTEARKRAGLPYVDEDFSLD